MTNEELAKAVARVLSNFSCPEISAVNLIPGEDTVIGIVTADGSLHVLTVEDA